jgi:hypothetical protein
VYKERKGERERGSAIPNNIRANHSRMKQNSPDQIGCKATVAKRRHWCS